MIIWESINYDINMSIKDYRELEINVDSVTPIKVKDEFLPLRNKLLEARDRIFEENGYDYKNKLDYKYDLLFGIELYSILNEKIGFTNRVATNDDVWRYLSICVVPDIVHARWGLNEDRYYKTPRRIWLKTIWWYIHLSWQNNKKDTYNILKNNTTDTIVQLVERPNLGYYVSMFRELMRQYKDIDDSSRSIFRRAMKLNTARLLTTSPELVEGGIKQYVKDLFKDAKTEA